MLCLEASCCPFGIAVRFYKKATSEVHYAMYAGYGGGMSSAKAALESDTRVLAFEAGRKHKIRVNAISAGPLGSRAAKAIGFIDKMIAYATFCLGNYALLGIT